MRTVRQKAFAKINLFLDIVGEKEGNIAVVGQGVNVPAGASVSAGQQVDENTEF